jgi:hypothetical protein
VSKSYSKHQQNIIRNYYQNREGISLQRLQELVTELYLSTGKQREKHWKSIVGHLEKLGIEQRKIDQLVKENKPELVADLVKKLMEKS